MSYEVAAELMHNPEYIAKVNLATTEVAYDVAQEILITGAETMFEKRANLATQVLRSPVSFQETFVRLCALQEAGNTPTAPSLYDTIKAGWNAVAGVMTNEIPNT